MSQENSHASALRKERVEISCFILAHTPFSLTTLSCPTPRGSSAQPAARAL
jgi:hypothetical protein